MGACLGYHSVYKDCAGGHPGSHATLLDACPGTLDTERTREREEESDFHFAKGDNFAFIPSLSFMVTVIVPSPICTSVPRISTINVSSPSFRRSVRISTSTTAVSEFVPKDTKRFAKPR